MQITLKSSKNITCFQYILIYLVLAMSGIPITAFIGNDTFLMIVLGISLATIILHKNMNKQLFQAIILIIVCGSFSMIWSSLSYGTILNLITNLLLVYLAIIIDRKNFDERFIKLSLFIVILSVVLFLLTYFFEDFMLSVFFSNLYHRSGDTGNQYGLLFYQYVQLHSKRNCGPYGEPGKYAIFLSCLLYYLLFRYRNSNRVKIKMLFVILIGIATCQSTTGYLGTLFILGCYLLSRNLALENRKLKYAVIVIILSVLVLFTTTKLGRTFWNSTVTSKIIENGSFSFNKGTAAARTFGINGIVQYIKDNPLSIISGIGYEKLQAEGLDGIAGLPALLLATGVGIFGVLYGFLFQTMWRYRKGFFDFVALTTIIINCGLGQPNIFPAIIAMTILRNKYEVAEAFKALAIGGDY